MKSRTHYTPKILVAVTFLLLTSCIATAQSIPAYDVTGSASFVLFTGQNFCVNFSYDLTAPTLINTSSISDADTVSDVHFWTTHGFGDFSLFTNTAFDLQWSNSGQPNNGLAPTTGLMFDLDQSTNFPFAQMHLYEFNAPSATGPGPALPYDGTFKVKAIRTPEPESSFLLLFGVGIVTLLGWVGLTRTTR